jgi:hypothetical protein
MEPIGTTASVIAIVQLTEFILKLAHKHMGLGPSQHDNRELQSISQALFAFNGVLQNLQTYLRINEENDARLQTLRCLTEPLERCKETLEILAERLKTAKFIGKHIIGERFDRKLKTALSEIEDARKLFQLALLSDQQYVDYKHFVSSRLDYPADKYFLLYKVL